MIAFLPVGIVYNAFRLAMSMSVIVPSPTLEASARVPSGESETSCAFLPVGTLANTRLFSASIIDTVPAPTLDTNASLPSRLKITLWAPLPVSMVAITLPDETPMTMTLPDFMLVTHTSWAQAPAAVPTAAIRKTHVRKRCLSMELSSRWPLRAFRV